MTHIISWRNPGSLSEHDPNSRHTVLSVKDLTEPMYILIIKNSMF